MTAGCASVPVTVGLRPDVLGRLKSADADLRRCRQWLTASLSQLMAELGLPAEPELSLAASPDAEFSVSVTIASSPSRLARLVAGQSLYWAGAGGLPMGPAPGLTEVLVSTPGPERAGRALAAMVTEVVRRDAALLITPTVTALWAEGGGLPAAWDPVLVLRELVRLGLPPGAGAEVAAALREYPAGSRAGLEAAVAARASTPWEILVSPASLREITADALRNPDRFRELRKSFAENTGVRLPKVTIQGDHSLPADAISFRVFGVTGPLVLLHDATPRALPGGAVTDAGPAAGGAAAAGPGANGNPAAGGAAASDPSELMAAALRLLTMDRIEALVTTTSTAEQLDQLGALNPKLQGLASAIGLDRVTRLLRALAAEHVNIQNLPLILQAALDYSERSAVPPDEAELLHQVRVRLSQTITRGAAAGADRLMMSRLPSELEDVSSAAAMRRLMAFTDQVMASGQQHGRILVTSPRARPVVRAAVAVMYPELPVIGDDELAGAPQSAES